MQIVILTTESLASKLMLTDFNTKTNTDFEAPPHILNSGRVSPGYVDFLNNTILLLNQILISSN